MRLEMNKFEEIFDETFWDVYNSRHEDEEKLKAFKEKALSKFEEMCKKAGDKWLLGTDEPTMLDIHCAGMWDMVYARDTGDVYKLSREVQDREAFAPAWTAFMERFRSHPSFKPYRFRHLAA